MATQLHIATNRAPDADKHVLSMPPFGRARKRARTHGCLPLALCARSLVRLSHVVGGSGGRHFNLPQLRYNSVNTMVA